MRKVLPAVEVSECDDIVMPAEERQRGASVLTFTR